MAALEASTTTHALDVAAPLHPQYDARRQVTKAVPGARLVHRRRLLNEEGRELTASELMMRRARRRKFKDVFLPRMTWEGRKDGYFFTTGTRGTGYYLDDSCIDYGDVDDEGYVLMRVAPPVALQRALPRRAAVSKRGLLFDEEFLAALGPAHGAPADRYCVVAPPWLGGMPAPLQQFEKEDSGSYKATFTNELSRERLLYLRKRYEEEQNRRKLYTGPKTLTVVAKKGAVVRAEKALDSAKLAVLEPRATCTGVEEAFAGSVVRCRLVAPVRGWVSRKVVACGDAEFGTLAEESAPARSATRAAVTGRAASNNRLVAEVAEKKKQIVDVDALVEAEDSGDNGDPERRRARALERVVIALPAACGEMAFRGAALVPIFAQRGPWAVRLKFKGADAQPLAFVATLKRATLRKPAAALLELFAKTHAAKYAGSDLGALRLHPEACRDHVASETLVCELLDDLDAVAPDLAASFVVRRQRGAGDSTALISARSEELATRARSVVDDWSSQAEILVANAKKGYGAPQTSAEIREYWDEQKRAGYKHWRTDAALRGFYTRTEDEAKVKEWDVSLQPRRGFLESASVYTDQEVAARKRRDAALGSSEKRLHRPSKRG